jgi:PAS domain S-box-containing protein
MKAKTRKDLLAEIEELRTRLEVAKETLRTLQEGDKVMLKEIAHLKKTNETLAQLASFPESNPNPVMEIDLTGNIHYLNLAVKQLFPDLQTIGPRHPYLSDLSSLTETFKHQGKSSIIRELKINNSWYEQAIYYVSENNRLRIYGLDITDRKKAEEALCKSQEDLDHAQEVGQIGSWRMDVQQNVLTWSDENHRIFGIPKGTSMTYETFLSTVHPDDREYVDTKWKAGLAGEPYDIEHRIVVGHQVKWVREKAYLEFDDTGMLLGGFGITQDITERMRMEKALRRSRDELEIRVQERTAELAEVIESLKVEFAERKQAEESVRAERQRFNDVLEMLPAYLVLLSPDYHVPFANRFFRERFGESHGQRCFEYLFGRSEPCEICETYTVLKTMSPHHWEWVGPDGRNYDVFDFPFTDTDGSTLILEMGTDITERKQAEDALKESESRLRHLSSQLLTVQENERKRVARELHDGIGQTLTAIKFSLESKLGQMGRWIAPQGISLESINSLTQKGIDEVRRIQMDLRPPLLDDLGILATLNWFCREYEKIYSAISIRKEIQIEEEQVAIQQKTVIFRVAQEAFNNIAKHSKANLVRLSLKKKEDRIELAVEDNGIGFDLEGVHKGFGFGSMRERTELSGGSFAIESTPGRGTVIRASWPVS